MGVAAAPRPELAAEHHKVIVVYPDDVVVPEQRAQPVGEHAIDAQVAAGVSAGIFLQVDAVVEDRPQHAVGEAVVILLDIVFRQVDENIVDLVHLDRLRLADRLLGDLAAPAEPHPAAILERGLDRDRHPPGQWRARRVGYGDAVGNNNQSRADASSQLDDSLVAVLMIPAMEYVCGKFPHSSLVSGWMSSDSNP